MGPDKRQGQLGQFADKLFDAAVFLGPLFDLGQQIHRDVCGVGFAFDLPGEIMARVLFASRAAAIRIATGAPDGDQTGGQKGALGLELVLSGLEGAADQGCVFRYFHTFNGLF